MLKDPLHELADKETHFKTVRKKNGDDPGIKGSLGSLHKVRLLVRCKLKDGREFESISNAEICNKATHDLKVLAVKPPRVCNGGRSSIVILMESGKVNMTLYALFCL